MALPTRPLGSSGMEITTVGLGTWAFGRYDWGSQNDDDSIAAIRFAVDSGVNWIDTAAIYGLGHAEEVVATALRAIPATERPYVFTKVGITWDLEREATRHVMDPVIVRREVEASLRRLQVEAIDLYQVHWPPRDDDTPLDRYWQVMADLKSEGKVRAIGLSNHDVAQLDLAEKISHVDAVQPPLSAINRRAAPEIAWAEARGIGVIIYSPLQSGLLSGSFSADRAKALPAGDWRRGHSDFTTGLHANLELVEALRLVAERCGVPAAALAVAWTLAWPGVTGAIVGARRPGQITDWLQAAALRLSATDIGDIADAIIRTGVGAGPAQA